MLCELWRLGNRHKIVSKEMSMQEKCEAFLSAKVNQCLGSSEATRNPDIYFSNPFTNEYQHLFRILDKKMVMRPSFLDNNVTSSVNLLCLVTYNDTSGKINVNWTGDYIRSTGISPQGFFTINWDDNEII